MFCFEDFDRHDKPMIKFELVLVPNDVEFPVWREQDNAENVFTPTVHEQVIDEANVEHLDDEPVEDAASDESDGIEVDNNYEVDDESEDKLDASLVEEDREVDSSNHDRCDPDGDETFVISSFDKENGLTRAPRYCRDNQWTLNPNGTIAYEDGQTIWSAEMSVIKMAQSNECNTSKASLTYVADVCSQIGLHPKP
ncbi:hypothetical protein QYF36_013572 [Acer negundo]|nr:hypothetical protein QYF36_013572 [Acer negundo]